MKQPKTSGQHRVRMVWVMYYGHQQQTHASLTFVHLCLHECQGSHLGMGEGPHGVCHLRRALSEIRVGNGTPLQYSCLENPMDGGAW